MSNSSRRRNVIIIVLLALIALILLLLARCRRPAPETVPPSVTSAPVAPAVSPAAAGPVAASTPAPEVLTPATVQAAAQIGAGAVIPVAWNGPANAGDFLTIAPKDAPAESAANYRETREGSPLDLTAPIAPGEYEIRYVAVRSRTILGRAPLTVLPAAATLDAAAEVILGTTISVAWTGPNNHGDYITIVEKDKPDSHYGNYTETAKGSPLNLVMPSAAGAAELRYVSGQGHKVLGRRAIKIVLPDLSLAAAAEAVAGASLAVTWTGPNNAGDYLTVVPQEKPDGHYGNYTLTAKGSPLDLLVPIMAGAAELRYMTGQGNKVLARRPLTIVAAEVSLAAPAEAAAGSSVTVTWTGPNHPGDYLTVVGKDKPDDQYGNYTYTTKGSPLTVVAPKEPGEAEVRYLAGQGNKVLARRTITITR